MLNPKDEIEQWGPIDGRILYASFWFLPSARCRYWPDMVCVLDHDRMTFYWDKGEMQKGGEDVLLQWILPRRPREKLWRDYLKLVAEMKGYARQKTLSPVGWYRYVSRMWQIVILPETANFAAPEYLRRKIEKVVPSEKINKILEILLAPERLSFHQQSELELLKSKNLEQYAKKWYWVENSYHQSRYLTAEDFAERLKKILKDNRRREVVTIANYPKEVRKKKKRLLNTLRLSKRITELADALSFSIWWQDHRKAVVWWSNSITDRFINELQRKYQLSQNDLMHYTAEEFVQLAQEDIPVSKREIEERKKFVVIEFKGSGFQLFYGRKARQMVKKFTRVDHPTQTKILQGITASAGKNHKVRGKVCVLRSARRAGKMKISEILVAPMTSPDYIVAMRKAKAIITDVGGLMSHAAIVSRELRIPCVVGTKVATRVFKDGDLVEVDADKGVVKMLKRAKK